MAPTRPQASRRTATQESRRHDLRAARLLVPAVCRITVFGMAHVPRGQMIDDDPIGTEPTFTKREEIVVNLLILLPFVVLIAVAASDLIWKWSS